jgi:hypothetical protein
MPAITSSILTGLGYLGAGATVTKKFLVDDPNAQRDAAKQMQDQQVETDAQIKESKDKDLTDSARETAIKTRGDVIARQKMIRAGMAQKGGTVLTGPSGGQTTSSTIGGSSGKTLLGS